MVDYNVAKTSNTHLPAHLTAVFVGGTSGIGLYTLLALAKHCQHPTIYFVGRSQKAADTILSDLNKTNPNGTYHFIQSDVSMIKNVDKVCEEIRSKESYINLLVLSQGTLVTGTETEEGLHTIASLVIHSRIRFILNLLQLLQSAPASSLRRVLTIFAGTKEGPIYDSDLQMRKPGLNPMKARGQVTSVVTLLLEEAQRRAPDVSFVHSFPGSVKSNIARGGGVVNLVMRVGFSIIGPFVCIPEDKSGERHLFLATSARFSSKKGDANGVAVDKNGEVAMGADGEMGSGVYVVDEKCESGGEKVVQVLKKLREEGKREFVWKEVEKDFEKITGRESL